MAKSRLSPRAQGEYREVFTMMVAEVVKEHPWAKPFLTPKEWGSHRSVAVIFKSRGEVMNIFYLDRDPGIAAAMHCDKHVVKMILETAQMLSTAHRVLD